MSEGEKPTEYEQFMLMERKDEEQILAELKGHYLDEFVYSFESAGRRVTGLSWVGVKECAYRMGGIDVETCIVEDKGDYWMVTVKAFDRAKGSSRFGASTQAKKIKMKDGSEQDDMFSLPKAVSKAQRNAIRALIPEAFIKTFIDRFLEEKRVERARPAAAPPPTPVTPAAKPVEVAAPKAEATHKITWTVDGEYQPIPYTRPYTSFMKNLMTTIQGKHPEISFDEDQDGEWLYAIYASDMGEKEWTAFENAFNWTLRKMANIPNHQRDRVRIMVEG